MVGAIASRDEVDGASGTSRRLLSRQQQADRRLYHQNILTLIIFAVLPPGDSLGVDAKKGTSEAIATDASTLDNRGSEKAATSAH